MMIAGLLVLWLFTMIGMFAAGRASKRAQVIKAEAKAIEPICGCGHHLAFHDPISGVCNQKNARDGRTKCKCQRYVGPEVSMAFFHPGMALGSAEQLT